jgi:UDP-N-acetylmuramoyl-tripeptide--D-alanyl-D-alanine ligase
LRAALAVIGPTHASEKSYNNHWGVPLTLARMPVDAVHGVFEIGMNHSGEIDPLTRMVRPHIAIITTVEAVHLGQFANVEEIADAKAEIFAGLETAGTAILNRDNPHFARLAKQAERAGAKLATFGSQSGCDVRLLEIEQALDGSRIGAEVFGRSIRYRLGVPGSHIAMNSLAVLAALACVDADLETALAPLANLGAPPGRGARTELSDGQGAMTLIDESYNANPASMRAALETMAGVNRSERPRRIAVLGDMLELGPAAADMHRALNNVIDAAEVDLVFACGPCMKNLFAALPKRRQATWAPTSDGLQEPLLAGVRAGDVVMVKGSLGSRMAPLVAALKERFAVG